MRGPRLVYADWLEEHGQGERATFIRWDLKAWAGGRASYCVVGSGPSARRLYHPWMLHETGAPPFEGKCVWQAEHRRGLISEITLPTDMFLRHAEATFLAHPVTAVWLDDQEPLNNAVEDPYLGEDPMPADWWGWVRSEPDADARYLAPWQLSQELWAAGADSHTGEKAALD